MPLDDASPLTDETRLRHMLDAGRSILRFCAGKARTDLDSDEMLVRAVLHALMEIGEAAARVGEPGRKLVPNLPWGQIVRVRNILVHVYWGVDLDKIWSTVQNDIPVLVAEISPVFSPPSDTAAS